MLAFLLQWTMSRGNRGRAQTVLGTVTSPPVPFSALPPDTPWAAVTWETPRDISEASPRDPIFDGPARREGRGGVVAEKEAVGEASEASNAIMEDGEELFFAGTEIAPFQPLCRLFVAAGEKDGTKIRENSSRCCEPRNSFSIHTALAVQMGRGSQRRRMHTSSGLRACLARPAMGTMLPWRRRWATISL